MEPNSKIKFDDEPIVPETKDNIESSLKFEILKRFKGKIDDVNKQINDINKKIHDEKINFESTQPTENVNKTEATASCPGLTDYLRSGKPRLTYSTSRKSLPSKAVLREKLIDRINRFVRPTQRYKIRSVSVPPRKFGFGSYSEIVLNENEFEPKMKRKSLTRFGKINKSKSRCSVKVITKRSKVNLSDSRKSSKTELKRCTKGVKRHSIRPQTAKTGHTKTDDKAPLKFRWKSIALERRGTKSENFPVVNHRPMLNESDFRVNNDIESFKGNKRVPDVLLQIATVHPPLKQLMKQKPVPFTPCMSTSKSFNIGLNVQQVLSMLKKSKVKIDLQELVNSSPDVRKSTVSVPVTLAQSVSTLFGNKISRPSTHVSELCPARTDDLESVSVYNCSVTPFGERQELSTHEDRKDLRKEDAWCVEQELEGTDLHRTSSKCTCFPTRKCIDFHKLVNQYVEKPRIRKSLNKFPQIVKPSIMEESFGDYLDDNMSCGDGVKSEIHKIHNDLVTLHRKYTSLQEQISENTLDDFEANAEIEAIESEVETREMEFKDLLSFYDQLLALKQRIKVLREEKCANVDDTSPKFPTSRPTTAMTMTRVLRQIQGIQEKIKEVNES